MTPRLASALIALRDDAPAAIGEQRQHAVEVHRAAIDIALHMAAPEPPDQRQIVVRLDPLGGRLHVECGREADDRRDDRRVHAARVGRSEEHTSELQSLMRISYAGFCLKKKNTKD